MTEEKNGVRWKYILSMVGAMIAYYIGASTGTGQEFFQSYSTQGLMGILGVTLQQIAIGALAFIVVLACQRYQLKTSKEFFIWFLGKTVGTVVYYYTAAFVFATLIQLISGTGAIVNQFYGLPYYIGAIGLSILLVISIMLGFKKMIDVIGKIGPFIIIVMILVAVISLLNPLDGLVEGSEMVLATDSVLRTSGTWWGSTILHHSYLILFLIPYFVSTATVGKKASNREHISWIGISFGILIGFTALMIASHIANVSVAIGSQAPNVAIASAHTPILATLLVLMIVAACYTTTAPIALIAADYFAKPDTTKHKIMGTIIVVVGLVITFVAPYDQIINTLIFVSGRIGLGVYLYAIAYRMYVIFIASKKGQVVEQVESKQIMD